MGRRAEEDGVTGDGKIRVAVPYPIGQLDRYVVDRAQVRRQTGRGHQRAQEFRHHGGQRS